MGPANENGMQRRLASDKLLPFVDEDCYCYLSRLAALNARRIPESDSTEQDGMGYRACSFSCPTKAFTHSSAHAETSVADRRHDKMRLKSAILFVHRVPPADNTAYYQRPDPLASVNPRVPRFPGKMHKNAILVPKIRNS